jgi:hypothetical protein
MCLQSWQYIMVSDMAVIVALATRVELQTVCFR